MEMEQVNKVVKLSDDPINNEEEKVDDVGERDDFDELSDMDKLPNETLMKILDYLDENELVKCRLLSSRWNEICCLLLQDKAKKDLDSRFVFRIDLLQIFTHTRKTFVQFMDCFRCSRTGESSGFTKPFPFSTWHLKNVSSMNIDLIYDLLSCFGHHMQKLFLNFDGQEIEIFKRLWSLLLHTAPNIQHLTVISECSSSGVTLFESVHVESLISNVKVLNTKTTFLKNIKVLGILLLNNGPHDFIKDLLDKTPNLKEVAIFRTIGLVDLVNLQILQKLQKMYLVQKLYISTISRRSGLVSPDDLMKNVRLSHLHADCDISTDSNDLEIATIYYISHALKSSQETLSTLQLSNLSTESMKICFSDVKSFPNVVYLEIGKIRNQNDVNTILRTFSNLCPSVKSLVFTVNGILFPTVGKIIWSDYKGMKCLKLNIVMTAGHNNSSSLDSTFSGYSMESIQKIQTKLDEGMSLEEARRNEKQNPSILNLADLGRLELTFCLGSRNVDTEEMENQLRSSVFIKVLPQYIRENPRSILYKYSTA